MIQNKRTNSLKRYRLKIRLHKMISTEDLKITKII